MAKTAIEALIDRANNDETHAGFHITAVFADGSIVDAPPNQYGPDWMLVSELEEYLTMIPTRDAVRLEINWGPGQAYAEGPRFAHLDAPKGRPYKRLEP